MSLSVGQKTYATGEALSLAHQALADAMVAGLESTYTGITALYDAWKAGGGQIGTLTGGWAISDNAKALTSRDGQVILLRRDGTPAQMQVRLFHELLHEFWGGALGPCQHAWVWSYTWKELVRHCDDLNHKIPCTAFNNVRSQFNTMTTMCSAVGGTPPPGPPDQNPGCCQ